MVLESYTDQVSYTVLELGPLIDAAADQYTIPQDTITPY